MEKCCKVKLLPKFYLFISIFFFYQCTKYKAAGQRKDNPIPVNNRSCLQSGTTLLGALALGKCAQRGCRCRLRSFRFSVWHRHSGWCWDQSSAQAGPLLLGLLVPPSCCRQLLITDWLGVQGCCRLNHLKTVWLYSVPFPLRYSWGTDI